MLSNVIWFRKKLSFKAIKAIQSENAANSKLQTPTTKTESKKLEFLGSKFTCSEVIGKLNANMKPRHKLLQDNLNFRKIKNINNCFKETEFMNKMFL